MKKGQLQPIKTACGSLTAFLRELIDYAGMYPPAALSMPDAVRLYATYRRGSFSPMLGRFVCGLGGLGELVERLRSLGPEGGAKPWPLTVLLPLEPAGPSDAVVPTASEAAGRSAAEVVAGFVEAELRKSALAEAAAAREIRVDAFEAKVPVSWFALTAPAAVSVAAAARAIRTSGTCGLADEISLFLEMPWQGERHRQFTLWADAVRAWNSGSLRERQGLTLGLKLRTGGMEPALVPPAGVVAGFIQAVAERRLWSSATGLPSHEDRTLVPFKATAGLHHPLRHVAPAIGVKEHGFFNVFFAALLAGAETMSCEAIVEMLEEKDPKAFQFEADGLRWRGRSLSLDKIRSLRERFAISFGSCSFEEPVEDLKTLGLLS